ncbi:MAG: hypothetical protein FIB08_16615 [Candidatus Methanoperedens sp.]|nr:hypothetical protein [Candidatus Methanoperedens sp.]
MFDRFRTANNIVVDTGPLLIHAVGAFRRDKVKDVCLCDDPEEEFEFLNKLFTSRKQFYITPYILSELLYKLRRELKLKEKDVEEFFCRYRDFLNTIGEFYIEKGKLINHKRIKFGLADISLMLAYKEKGYLIISGDEVFCRLCEKENIEFIEYKTFFFNRIFM